ncbi:efflux RND transporter permease subunit [Oceanobacter antarcticus]|uniref:MMPL family transporter n=1 Tax=Oceanobacter antarcticus TaxID=3133425 RepID=A0ABW8NM60_9GAMM
MHTPDNNLNLAPVGLDQFDKQSGNALERLLFNNRLAIIVLCVVVTALLGWQASHLSLNASYEKTIPTSHPYIANFLEKQDDLKGLGNSVRIAVANTSGSIYDADYMATLQQISDEVFLLPGVDRTGMKSLWTPNTRWIGVTEEGLEGGPVIPDGYNGSAASLAQLEANIARSGEVGQLVALDATASAIYVPLLAQLPDGSTLDYEVFSKQLEDIRSRYEHGNIQLHITGFAKIMGDLIDGLYEVLTFFLISIAIVTSIVYLYTRCFVSTKLVVTSSLIAVVWQLGLISALGYSLDPYSMLVPFLVFAIGMSHGAQKMNGIMQDIGRGAHKYVAARYTFRRLFMAGLTALLADAVGFAVLLVIDIKVIQELAIAASLGVGVLIFTNLILLPILLSYTGVSAKAAKRSLRAEESEEKSRLWAFLDLFTRRGPAIAGIAVMTVIGGLGYWGSTHLKIGDLDPGAPELRQDSRYNQDVAFMSDHFGASSDVFAIMVETDGQAGCANYEALRRVDALEWQLRQLPGVVTTNSMALLNRQVLTGLNEGNPKWFELIKNQSMLNFVTASAPRGLYNDACSLLTLYVYLADHKADTLTRIVEHVEGFAAVNNTDQVRFKLAAGSAGIEAATNIVVKDAWRDMLFMVYGAVILLCFITFRSWRAVVVAILPLVLTSLLAEALMVALGMGVKVATLPVIALGVGIGVDYALYILSVTLTRMEQGESLSDAYQHALAFTGKVVLMTGMTLAAGVSTWVFSVIKFQADMGILLAFMFLWNMVGAMVLLPALGHFLLRSKTKTQNPGSQPLSGDKSRPVNVTQGV